MSTETPDSQQLESLAMAERSINAGLGFVAKEVLAEHFKRELAAVTKERDELKTQLARSEEIQAGYLQNAVPTGCPACAEGVCCGSTSAEHENCIITRLEELTKDKERMDWLEANPTAQMIGGIHINWNGDRNLREAIDAARQ